MTALVVTIDGPAGVGKSTVARLLAKELHAQHLDTGAMYRAVTLAAISQNIELTNTQQLLQMLDNTTFEFIPAPEQMTVKINNTDVTKEIRDPQLTAKVKHIAPLPEIRARLVKMQQDFAAKFKTIVTEGRDQGTVAFPDAKFKFFLTADTAERAKRRQKDLQNSNDQMTLEQIQNDIETRDLSDRTRTTGPLTPDPDAITIDTSNITADQVVHKMITHIQNSKT